MAFGKAFQLAVLCGTVMLCRGVGGQDATPQPASRPAPKGDDEIIVYGSIPELRRQLLRTRDAMFLRFNEINSDDKFDLHCYVEPIEGSHIRDNAVTSGRKAWREKLAAQEFTIAARPGDVHELTLTCEHGTETLEYQPNSEWTLPNEYGACRLQVDATPGAKFIVYEFE